MLDFDGDQNTTETTRSFYHRNALGSVMSITDMAEVEAVSYAYDPYGAVTITHGGSPQSTDPLGNPWMYTGRFNDEESGLEYYRARYYSTSVGRFLQRDPLGSAAGPNPYAYAASNPMALSDPLGLDEESPVQSATSPKDPLRKAELKEMREALEENGHGGWINWLMFLVISDDAINHIPLMLEFERGKRGEDSGPHDALYHCVWQCQLAKAFGEKAAKKIGDIHEDYGMKRAMARKARGQKTSARNWPTDQVEREVERNKMDQWNNTHGRHCAELGKQCIDCCRGKLALGRLLWAPDGELGRIGPRPCKTTWPRPLIPALPSGGVVPTMPFY